MTSQFVQLLPHGPAAFSVHLERAVDSALEDPFVRLESAGGTTRVYRGSLRSAGGAEVCQVTVLVPALPRAESPRPWPLMDEEWQVRWADQRQLADASPRLFPRLLLPSLEGPEADRRLPPMVFCRIRQRVLPIPSPWSLRPLVTCRDDELLVRYGLPPTHAATLPILYDAESIGEEDPPRFFVAVETVPDDLATQGVAGLSELRAELAATLAERLNADPQFDHSRFPATVAPSTEGGDDGDSSSAELPWFVFSTCDVPFMVRAFEPWGFDAFADFLGGRNMDPRDPVDVPKPLEAAGTGAARASGFLFAGEGSGIDAVEVLTLKLVLFAQVVEAVDLYYRHLGPHLDLHPEHLVVSAPLPDPGLLPTRWHFCSRLLGLSSARRSTLPQGVVHAVGPSRPRRPYASKSVREASLVDWCEGELVIDQLLSQGEGEELVWRLKGRLRDPNGILPPPKTGDSLIIHWPQQLLGRDGMQTTAVADPDASTSASELIFYTEPIALQATQAQRLESAASTVLRGGRYRLLPRLDVNDDLYSLGILLLRLLLANDQQNLGAVEVILRDLPEFNTSKTDTQGLSFEQRVEASLTSALEDQTQVFDPSNVFFGEEDRLTSRANAIPPELWTEILRLAWRLLARRPILWEGDGAERDLKGSEPQLMELFHEVTHLVSRLQVILFRRQAVHVEMHSVIAEMMAGLDGEKVARAD